MRNARDSRSIGSTTASRRVLSDGEASLEGAAFETVTTEDEPFDGRAERFEGEILQKYDF